MRMLDRTWVAHPVSDGDHDLALGVPLAKVGYGFTSLVQRVRPTNDRHQPPGLNELLQDEQIVPLWALRSCKVQGSWRARCCTMCERGEPW